MRSIKRSLKQASLWVLATVLIYWLGLRKRPYTVVISKVIPNQDPKHVWSFVADFSNHKLLNPTIDTFDLDFEHGNYATWEYGVTVREHLAQLPFVSVWIKSHYIVVPPAKPGSDPYRINSQHVSCVWWYCVDTNATMVFSRSSVDPAATQVTESMVIECPPILSRFCLADNRKQKDLIHENMMMIDFRKFA